MRCAVLARTPVDLGLIVRDRRRKLGLDQRALASAIGVNRQWVIDLEKGRPGAGIAHVLRALHALKLRLLVEPWDATPARTKAAGRPVVDIDDVVEEARRPRR